MKEIATAQSFYHWMQRALYHPQSGYYRRPGQRVGRQGDFVTSVSSGQLLGKLLAQKLVQCWEQAGSPAQFQWIEQGAESGQLSCDLLSEVQLQFPELARALKPIFIEPWAENIQRQKQLLEQQLSASTQALREATQWLETPHQLTSLPSLFFANELLDAFPAQVFERTPEAWHELAVATATSQESSETRLEWTKLPPLPPSSLPPGLSQDLPAPWQWEHQPELLPWLNSLSQALPPNSTILLLDYGFTHSELRDPARREGTLRGYHQHHQVKPLDLPAGQADLTVHIHWDELRQAAQAQGWQEKAFQEQGRYLTQLAKPLLLQIEAQAQQSQAPPNPSLIRQLQSLLHPAHLGAKFQALELHKA